MILCVAGFAIAGEFDLMTYRLSTHVRPLIWVESLIETYSGRIEYMIKAKSQFKSRSIANGVEIRIPVPPDVDSPSFKTAIGTVAYFPDQVRCDNHQLTFVL